MQGGSKKLLLKTKESIVLTVLFLDHPQTGHEVTIAKYYWLLVKGNIITEIRNQQIIIYLHHNDFNLFTKDH